MKIPYKTLYIYYLEGQVKYRKDLGFGKNFIGNWQEEDSSFLFFDSPADNEVQILLKKQPHLILVDSYSMPYDQWQGGIEPFIEIGSFIVHPPWNKIDTDHNKIPIILDPGVVFGTGTHFTTKDCLEAIELACYKHNIKTASDLGAGTGLLSLAAAKSGIDKIIAVDFNFLAAKTTYNNILLNNFENRIISIQGLAQDFICQPVDLLITNIHYDVMKDIIAVKEFLNTKVFILSGLLRSQFQEVLYKLSKYPVKIIKTWEGEGIWHTVLGEVDL